MPGPYSFFPSSTTVLIDDFNRPDGGLGANWTIMNTSPLRILSHKCAPGAGGGNYTDLYNPTTYANVETYATMDVQAGTRNQITVRDQGVIANAPAAYYVFYQDGVFQIGFAGGGGVGTVITVASGDKMGIRVTGLAGDAIVEGWLFQSGAWSRTLWYHDVAAPPQFNSGYTCLSLGSPGSTGTARFYDLYAGPFTNIATIGRLPLLGAG